MDEVKKSDIELVTNALWQYFEHMKKTRKVNLKEFVNFMEPIFDKAGYRQNPKGEGHKPISFCLPAPVA